MKVLRFAAAFVGFCTVATLAWAQGDPIPGRSALSDAFSVAGNAPISVIAKATTDLSEVSALGVENATTEAGNRLVDAASALGVTADRIGQSDLVILNISEIQLDQLIRQGVVSSVQFNKEYEVDLASATPTIQAAAMHNQLATGAGTLVVVVDTGVQANHPFLNGRVVEEACFSGGSVGTTTCRNGANSDSGIGSASPCSSTVIGCDHGTHVAGIVASSNAVNKGVAPATRIAALQASAIAPAARCKNGVPCPKFSDGNLLKSLEYVKNTLSKLYSISAVNMSLGGNKFGACPNDYLATAINQLAAIQIATVISSGNDAYTDGVGSPGCVPTAITVGSTDDSGTIAPDSNSHAVVDVVAPGVNITSSIPGGGSAAKSGTSMATPMVSGGFAALQGFFAAPIGNIEGALKSSGNLVPTLAPGVSKPRIRLKAAFDVLLAAAPAGADGWMKDTWNDTGLEPDPGSVGQPMSGSPAIWIRHQNDCPQQLFNHQNPKVGIGNIACIQLRNRGKIQANGTLELYISTANIDAATGWRLLTSKALQVGPTGSTIVSLPLPPLPGPGHYCLLARWVSTDEYVSGVPGPLKLPGGLNAAVRNDNDLVWRNVDIIKTTAPKPNTTAIQYTSEPGGTVNLVVKISALDPQQIAELGTLLLELGIDPAVVLKEPTSKYYTVEGGRQIEIPLKAGVYYIPDAKVPPNINSDEFFATLTFKFNEGLPESDKPKMTVEVFAIGDIAEHKKGAANEEGGIKYQIE